MPFFRFKWLIECAQTWLKNLARNNNVVEKIQNFFVVNYEIFKRIKHQETFGFILYSSDVFRIQSILNESIKLLIRYEKLYKYIYEFQDKIYTFNE